MSDKFTNFFFSLDEVLDTRLAVLDSIDPVATLELLQNGYFEREIDDWEMLTNGKIKNEDFKLRYKNRNKELLKKSKLSGFCNYIKDFIIESEKLFGTDPTVNKPKIILNVYPYTDLNDVERLALKDAVEICCSCVITEVEICCYSPAEIGPGLIKGEYEFTFMYHFEEWKALHIDSIGKQIMMGCYITAPQLYLGSIPEEEIYQIDEGLRMTPWQAGELCMLPFMVLNFIPVKNFSLFLP